MRIDYKLIGQRIKGARKEKKITQEQLAEQLSVTVGYVSQMERGVTKINLDTLAQIAFILDYDIAFFITGTCVKQDSYMQEELTQKYLLLNQTHKKMLMDMIDVFLQYQSQIK